MEENNCEHVWILETVNFFLIFFFFFALLKYIQMCKSVNIAYYFSPRRKSKLKLNLLFLLTDKHRKKSNIKNTFLYITSR